MYSQIHRYWIHVCALEHVLGGVLLEHGGGALRVHKYFRHVLGDTEEVGRFVPSSVANPDPYVFWASWIRV